MQVNLGGSFFLAQAAANQMKNAAGWRIYFIYFFGDRTPGA